MPTQHPSRSGSLKRSPGGSPRKLSQIDLSEALSTLSLVEDVETEVHDISRSGDTSTQSRKWKRILRITLPHFFLFSISFAYVLLGAYVFRIIEEPHWMELRNNTLQELQTKQDAILDKLFELKQAGATIETADKLLDQYQDEVYETYRDRRLTILDIDWENPIAQPQWAQGMTEATFFVVSMLTTIGYGNTAPISTNGRTFCICYGLIGFPLLLIVVADLAKFLSTFVTNLYIRYLLAKQRMWLKLEQKYFPAKARKREQAAESDEKFADYLWENLDDADYVKVPAVAVLAIVIAYCALGGYLFSKWEQWSFFESFYFSFVSALKIGFGDYCIPSNNCLAELLDLQKVLGPKIRPDLSIGELFEGIQYVPREKRFISLALMYIFFGLIITTMCVDIVGVNYLDRIHNWGRRLGEADYLRLLQRSKMKKRKREAMRSMFDMLSFVRHVKMPDKWLTDYMAKNQQPPKPPSEVYVDRITPYSVRLVWSPPEESEPDDDLSYSLSCKNKSTSRARIPQVTEYTDIRSNVYEVGNLQSFSIYEFGLKAVNKYGSSQPVKLIQITEPATAPQNIRAEVVDEKKVRLTWESPFKKKNDVLQYTVYYTKDPVEPYEKWAKRVTDAHRHSLTLSSLEQEAVYAFSVAANYKSGHSPFSRSLFANVKPGEIGTSSHSSAKPESIPEETTPLLGGESV